MENTEIDKASLYRNIIENNWNAIVFANMQGIVEFVNPAANELYGFEGDELIGQNVDIFNSHLTHNTEDIVNSLIEKGHWYGELIQRRKDDSTFDALLHVQIIKDANGAPIGYASNSKDISEDNVTRKKLRQIIAEKEVLIREIHHRVKNNLAIVQGMLRLHEKSSKQISMEEFVIDFQTRISVLSEAHNNLSVKDANIQEISLDQYLKTIILDVAALFNNEKMKVKIDFDFQEIVVPLDTAIPCGLIVNEVVTNSFKHALNKEGNLTCALNNSDDEYCLTITDDGNGFDFEQVDLESSVGLSLIDGLTDQLGGSYKFEKVGKGQMFDLCFTVKD